MQAADWFSVDYSDAREKFLAAAAYAGAGIVSFRNPAAGPQGEALFADAAWLGPEDAQNVLMTCSATHGIEGFCGSGAQVGTFRSGILRDLPTNFALLAVHAINPHGFAWQRRVTEDNVDFNRNCIDHSGPHPRNGAYAEIHHLLVPAEWNGSSRDEADRGIEDFIQTRGLATFQAAVSGGQYDHPDGLFYGGRAPTWSNRTMHAIFEKYLKSRRRVVFLDYHTGLGPSGYGELIGTHAPDSAGFARAKSWFGDVTSPDDGSSSSAPIQGYIGMAMERALSGVEITAMALEYGTVPVPEVLQALRADNWLHLRGDPKSAQGVAIKNQVRAAFYVETPLWKQQVWQRAAEVTRMAARAVSGGN